MTNSFIAQRLINRVQLVSDFGINPNHDIACQVLKTLSNLYTQAELDAITASGSNMKATKFGRIIMEEFFFIETVLDELDMDGAQPTTINTVRLINKADVLKLEARLVELAVADQNAKAAIN